MAPRKRPAAAPTKRRAAAKKPAQPEPEVVDLDSTAENESASAGAPVTQPVIENGNVGDEMPPQKKARVLKVKAVAAAPQPEDVVPATTTSVKTRAMTRKLGSQQTEPIANPTKPKKRGAGAGAKAQKAIVEVDEAEVIEAPAAVPVSAPDPMEMSEAESVDPKPMKAGRGGGRGRPKAKAKKALVESDGSEVAEAQAVVPVSVPEPMELGEAETVDPKPVKAGRWGGRGRPKKAIVEAAESEVVEAHAVVPVSVPEPMELSEAETVDPKPMKVGRGAGRPKAKANVQVKPKQPKRARGAAADIGDPVVVSFTATNTTASTTSEQTTLVSNEETIDQNQTGTSASSSKSNPKKPKVIPPSASEAAASTKSKSQEKEKEPTTTKSKDKKTPKEKVNVESEVQAEEQQKKGKKIKTKQQSKDKAQSAELTENDKSEADQLTGTTVTPETGTVGTAQIETQITTPGTCTSTGDKDDEKSPVPIRGPASTTANMSADIIDLPKKPIHKIKETQPKKFKVKAKAKPIAVTTPEILDDDEDEEAEKNMEIESDKKMPTCIPIQDTPTSIIKKNPLKLKGKIDYAAVAGLGSSGVKSVPVAGPIRAKIDDPAPIPDHSKTKIPDVAPTTSTKIPDAAPMISTKIPDAGPMISTKIPDVAPMISTKIPDAAPTTSAKIIPSIAPAPVIAPAAAAQPPKFPKPLFINKLKQEKFLSPSPARLEPVDENKREDFTRPLMDETYLVSSPAPGGSTRGLTGVSTPTSSRDRDTYDITILADYDENLTHRQNKAAATWTQDKKFMLNQELVCRPDYLDRFYQKYTNGVDMIFPVNKKSIRPFPIRRD